MTETEEKTLLQWILTMNKYGVSFKPTTIWSMADLLLADCDTLKPPFTVEINWVYKFVQHYNTLKTCFSWKYDHQQALYENSSKIQKWFKLVQSIIKEWRIIDEVLG